MSSETRESGIILIDKEEGISSFDVIRRLKRSLAEKKIGHGGTLDPFASGLLICLVSRSYTKTADSLLNAKKVYECTIKLSQATDSYDLTGEITQENSYEPTEEELSEALKKFQGEILQVPPMFSAKRIQGQRLYKLARQGKEVAREPVKIHVITELLSYNYPLIKLRIEASKGTYIRSIGHDLAQALNTCGHLTELRRVAIGKYSVSEALSSKKFLFETPFTEKNKLLLENLLSEQAFEKSCS